MKPQLEPHRLARDFERAAVPAHGRYVGRPTVSDEPGVVAVPPREGVPNRAERLAAGAVGLAGLILARHRGSDA